MGNLEKAFQSLQGLSVGDALGNLLTFQELASVAQDPMPTGPWNYTDDTEMALSIYEMLEQRGRIDPDRLATDFSQRYTPRRGYGTAARKLLEQIGSQPVGSWRQLTPALFFGQGSYGNGAAMRVAPLGAFFGADSAKVVEQARMSAIVTHSHAEGIAGAIAVAAAAAWLAQDQPWDRQAFFDSVLSLTPTGITYQRIQQARDLDPQTPSKQAAALLGNGHEMAAQDTAPFCLWSAAVDPNDFAGTFWRTLVVGGDQDTLCAITCGVIAARTAPPADWLEQREPLPRGFSAP